MTKKQKAEAVSIFKELNIKELYLNDKGNFFTSENLALNSVENAESITTLHRDKVLSAKKAPDKEAEAKPESN